MKNQIQKFIAGLVLVIFFIGCSKDSSEDGPGGCVAEAEKVTESLNNYVNDPSVENCKAYIASLRNYLDANACFSNLYYESYQKALEDLNDHECQ